MLIAVALLAIVASRRHLFTPRPEVLAPRGADVGSYVGAAKCAECHREIGEQQSCSRMAVTLQTAEQFERTHSLPLPAEVVDRDNGLRYRVDRRNGKLCLQVWHGGQIARADMTYALGSNKTGITFVRDLDAENYQELRVSYFTDTNSWDLTPGHSDARPSTAAQALGRPVNKLSRQGCLTCHATLLVQSAATIDLARSRFGVHCERCHGPGRDHIESVMKGREAGTATKTATAAKMRPPVLDEAMALARRLREGQPARTKLEGLLRSAADTDDERLIHDLYVCGECHGRHEITSPPSDDLLPKFPLAALVDSRCYRESATKIRCGDCHDPHGDSSPGDVAIAVAVCLQCHAGTAPVAGSQEPKKKTCPVNTREGCIGCHMPIGPVVPHIQMTQHRIGIYGHRAE